MTNSGMVMITVGRPGSLMDFMSAAVIQRKWIVAATANTMLVSLLNQHSKTETGRKPSRWIMSSLTMVRPIFIMSRLEPCPG